MRVGALATAAMLRPGGQAEGQRWLEAVTGRFCGRGGDFLGLGVKEALCRRDGCGGFLQGCPRGAVGEGWRQWRVVGSLW